MWLAAILSFVFLVAVIMVATAVVRIAERLAIEWALVATLVPSGLLTFALWWVASYGIERFRDKASNRAR